MSRQFQPLLVLRLLALAMGLPCGLTAQPADVEAQIKKMEIAAGFKVSLFAAEPFVQNPVSFSIDHDGRFFIAETHRWDTAVFDITKKTNWLAADLSFRTVENRGAFLLQQFAANPGPLTQHSERITLLEDQDRDGRADRSTVFAEGFRQPVAGPAAGVLAWNHELWFASVPELWRFSSASPGPATPAASRKLAEGFGVHIGVSGHDLHGLALGPDGRVYFSMGDRGLSLVSQEGKKIEWPDTGAVLRCMPDGSRLEVFATGLRNPQELAFDDEGNLWTHDNDTAGADPSRLLHVVERGDYGWRCSYQHMRGFGPWVQETNWQGRIDGILPMAGVVAQGPSGLVFNPGTGLGPGDRGSFFLCDFPGGVWRFTVAPEGASYRLAAKSKLLWNLWPTDVDFGPDGAMYVSDWVAGWTQPNKGRIFKITSLDSPGPSFHNQVRESLESTIESKTEVALGELLAHPDRRVRLRAQFALAARGPAILPTLMGLARSASSPLARRHALWGLHQLHVSSADVRALLLKLLADPDEEVRRLACEIIGDLRIESAAAELAVRFRDPSPRVRFHALLNAGKLRSSSLASSLVEYAARGPEPDPFILHALASSLSEFGDWQAIEKLAGHEESSSRRVALLAMRRAGRPEIQRFLSDPSPALESEAARAIYDLPIPEAMRSLARTLGSSDLPAASLSRAIEANYRLGDDECAQRLVDWASKLPHGGLDSMKVLALARLGDWAAPASIDGILGLWRPLPKRTVEPARRAFHDRAAQRLAQSSDLVAKACLDALGKLGLNPGWVRETALDDQRGSEVRLAAMQVLRTAKDPALASAIARTVTSPDKILRRGSIEFLASVQPEGIAEKLGSLLNIEEDLATRQAVFAALGASRDPNAVRILEREVDRWINGSGVPSELQLDLVMAAGKSGSPSLLEKIDRHRSALAASNPLAPYDVSLRGGNSAEGKKVFEELAGVECLRCHAIQGNGGTVGPDLTRIGAQRSREELLESILFPNAKISPGFDSVLVNMRNGTVYAGIIKSESPTELTLLSPEDGLLRLKPAEIASRSRSLSAMPEETGKSLTPVQLRDLVEFLAGLK